MGRLGFGGQRTGRLPAWSRLLLPVTLLLFNLACGNTPAAPDEDPPGGPPPYAGPSALRVIFVGNSLTQTNDLPGMVGTLVEAMGLSWEIRSVLAPGYALEDHWRAGVGGEIRTFTPDFAILQQGPSSLATSRENLVAWTDTLTRVIRDVRGTPALLMVWPEVDRYEVFDAVRESYLAAARRVGGRFIPAGEGFRRLHESYPALEPYGVDGFHPTVYGSLVSALIVVRAVSGAQLPVLPGTIVPTDPVLPTIQVTDEDMATLTAVAEAAVTASY